MRVHQPVFTPEIFPMHSWEYVQPQAKWLDKIESWLDWILGVEEQ